LKDEENSPVAGLIHKYPNRVLLITSRVCAIHCQYCFRQNFNYIGHDAVSNYLAIEDYIYRHPKINEVILSGGDPLSLSDEKLAQLIFDLKRSNPAARIRTGDLVFYRKSSFSIKYFVHLTVLNYCHHDNFNIFYICLNKYVVIADIWLLIRARYMKCKSGVKKSPSPMPGASNFYIWAS
jgi:hypothetical protein